GVNQGRVQMGHLGVAISNPDHLALGVMNGILGGNGFTSRIMERVRSDEGLAYSAASSFHAGTYYEGVFTVGFQSKSPSVAQAITIVNEEIERFRTTKVGAEELSLAIGHAVEGVPLRFATPGQKAAQFANAYFFKLPGDDGVPCSKRVDAIPADEIQRVARKYLQ